MSNIIKNQAIKLYEETETLFNEKTSKCVWHHDYSPLVACDDVSEIVLNTTVRDADVGVDSDFSFVVTGNSPSGGATSIFTDAGATFITDGVQAGMYFMKYLGDVDDITDANVEILSVDSETQITLASSVTFTISDYYEISEWIYVGDIRTVNGYAEIDNQVLTTTTSALRQTIEDETLYKVEFTITFIDPDDPASFLSVGLGSNTVLSLFADDIEAKKYTVFGKSDGTLFQLAIDGNPKLNIDDIIVSKMYDTSYEIKNCNTDDVEYTSVDADFVYSNTSNQLKMLIDWSSVECDNCYYIDVWQGSETGGIESISNGDFAAGDTDWNVATGWSIYSGLANYDDTGNGSLTQTDLSVDLSIGISYTLSFFLTYAAGVLNVSLYKVGVLVQDMGDFNTNGLKSISTGVLTSEVDEIRFKPIGVGHKSYLVEDVSLLSETITLNNYRTDCINVSNELDCTIKLSGTNNDNAFGIDFESLSYNPFIRVQGELTTPKYDGDKENEEDSLGINKTLYFKSETKRDLFIYDVPEYHHEFIRLLLGYDTFLIDDVEYVSTSAAYSPENERILGKLPDLSSSTTEVRLEDDLNENKFC